MRASEFEFRHRFWTISGIFCAGFSAYRLDHVNVVVEAVRGLGVDPASPRFDLWVAAGFGFGALLAVLAALVRTWAAAYLSSAVIHDGALHTEALVADGPYRHVRNPLYLGLILLACGLALAASDVGALIIIGGMFVIVLRLIGREEAELARTQGAGFEAFRRAVPRLLPALRPRLPASGRQPRWGQAFLGESFLWILAAASIVFAATRNAELFGQICGIGMLVYLVFVPIWKRRRR